MPYPPAAETAPSYLLQPGDTVAVRVLGDPGYDATAIIAPDGTVAATGLEQPVMAGGLSAEALRDRLVRLYRRAGLLERPALTVTVQAFGSQEAFIGGEVRRPGLLKLAGPRTVLQAVIAGGGPLPTADLSDVRIVRTGPDGRARMFRVDLARVLGAGDLDQNVPVQALDVILVPPAGIAAFDTWVDQYVRQALPVPVRLLLDAFFHPFHGF